MRLPLPPPSLLPPPLLLPLLLTPFEDIAYTAEYHHIEDRLLLTEGLHSGGLGGEEDEDGGGGRRRQEGEEGSG